MVNSLIYLLKGWEDRKRFTVFPIRPTHKRKNMENMNGRFIVAEISKNWQPNSEAKELLSQGFEKVINVNLERGYRLIDWKPHVFINGLTVNETIIAIFEKIEQS